MTENEIIFCPEITRYVLEVKYSVMCVGAWLFIHL